MTDLARFTVSLSRELLSQFDRHISKAGYPTRSKAISDLVAESLVTEEWHSEVEVAGVIILVYDHHRRGLSNRLTGIQHDFHHLIISTQHIHLDHDNCLEIVVTRGLPGEVTALAGRLKTAKGVKHSSLAMATTGKGIRV